MRSSRTPSLTRRAFLARATLTGGTLAAASALFAPMATALRTTDACAPTATAAGSRAGALRGTVVAFFDGQLWLDTSGTSVPYEPPRGARAAAPLASLTEAELRSIHSWL